MTAVDIEQKGSHIGVLLVNLGTPDQPTPSAIRRYLKEFLSDPRVVDYPRWLWLPLLYGVILPVRSRKVAAAYQSIWTDAGSPLRAITQQQHAALQAALALNVGPQIKVASAMTYGSPNIRDVLPEMVSQGVRNLVVLPLYPQYSCSTTASVFDAVARACEPLRYLPEIRMTGSYQAHPLYIDALAASVRRHWESNGRGQLLLLSFHGIPERYGREGDPYPQHCQQTATALAQVLGLERHEYKVSFQSRVGKEEWLKPYTDKTLEVLPGEGIDHIDVICPAFSADCLETLEEIAEENREVFMEAGGKEYNYVPALNAEPKHIDLMVDLIKAQLQGW